jgi:arylsulfatase A
MEDHKYGVLSMRYTLVWLLIVLLSALTISCNSYVHDGPFDESPNIMIILVDDLGYGDLGSYNHPVIKTPNLDAMAAQGLKLTSCYASAPMCSPSRAGLLTGRVPYRTGVYDWIAPDSTMYLPQNEITIASLLQDAGYQTCLTGKWHLNGKFNVEEQPQPNDHGFEYWFGVQFSLPHLNPEGFVRNGKAVETKGYACDIVAMETNDWLRNIRDKDKPFFQFVNFLEPHEPIMSPPDIVAQYGEYGIKAEYYANVTNLDQAIGQILETLDELELSENTLVIFTSDNGPAQYTPNGYFNKSHGSAGPLKGYKRHMYEGGIRVPGIIRWPDRIEGGNVSDVPISNVDIFPTLCRIAGIQPPTDRIIDGSDISPLFTGDEVIRKSPLHWHFYDPWGGPQSVIREGDYMVGASWDVGDFHAGGRFDPPSEVPIIKGSNLASFEMYNLTEDIHQDEDLKESNPELFRQMSEELIGLHKSVMQVAPLVGFEKTN